MAHPCRIAERAGGRPCRQRHVSPVVPSMELPVFMVKLRLSQQAASLGHGRTAGLPASRVEKNVSIACTIEAAVRVCQAREVKSFKSAALDT